jgi:hypothetical protein
VKSSGRHSNYGVGSRRRVVNLKFLPTASPHIWNIRANPNIAGAAPTTRCGLPVGTEGRAPRIAPDHFNRDRRFFHCVQVIDGRVRATARRKPRQPTGIQLVLRVSGGEACAEQRYFPFKNRDDLDEIRCLMHWLSADNVLPSRLCLAAGTHRQFPILPVATSVAGRRGLPEKCTARPTGCRHRLDRIKCVPLPAPRTGTFGQPISSVARPTAATMRRPPRDRSRHRGCSAAQGAPCTTAEHLGVTLCCEISSGADRRFIVQGGHFRRFPRGFNF